MASSNVGRIMRSIAASCIKVIDIGDVPTVSGKIVYTPIEGGWKISFIRDGKQDLQSQDLTSRVDNPVDHKPPL